MTDRGGAFDIVCLSANHWSGLPTSKQHLMSVLAATHRVLYIEPPIDAFSVIGRRRRWPKLRGLRAVGENLWVLSPVSGSVRSAPDRRLAYYRRLAPRVQRAAGTLGFDRPVVWSFSPEHEGCASLLTASVRVYQAADEPAAMSPDPDRTSEMERAHIERSDLVFVASESLLEARKHLGDVRRMPNAADRRHFSRVLTGNPDASLETFVAALERPRSRPEALPSAGGPLVLFGGAAYSWFDVELFVETAELRPDWNIALVGPLGREASQARLPANVTAVGRREYDEFPLFVAAADVCIMPWRLDRFTHNADPIVLYEYLLCGKPVVSTPFPAALEHGNMVRTSSTAGGFAAEITRALELDRSDEERLARVEFGFSCTWEKRAREAERLIADALASRAGAADPARSSTASGEEGSP